MQNFGEALTYWYLRLNGFFPLSDLVLHRYNGTHNADIDLLALRLPHTYERIGGLAADLDTRFQMPWERGGMELKGRTVGLIVQVKTGDVSPGDLNEGLDRAFSPERLLIGVQRLGILSPTEAAIAIDALRHRRSTEFPPSSRVQTPRDDFTNKCGRIVAKILVTEEERPNMPGYFAWNLVQMSEFIVNRFERLQDKDGGRLFFPSDLIQYLAWVGKRRRQ